MILNGNSSSVGNGGNGVCKFPFTPSQWQELEHQALIFKFIISNIPIPPDLLFTLKRSFLLSSSTSPHTGWSCFQMGLGLGMRKIDPEPGRCRRTDGKKWRCSKEAFHESKYCEKHMHRGKNRSRKHVEQPQQQPQKHQQLQLQHVFTSSSSLSSAGYCNNIHPYNHSTQLGLQSGVDRYENGYSNGGRMINSKEEYPLLMKFQGYESSRTCEGDYDDDDDDGRRAREKTVYRFLEECPPDDNNNVSGTCSWLKLDDNKSSNCCSSSSSSTTQLSISIPNTTSSTNTHHHQQQHELFPMFNSTHF